MKHFLTIIVTIIFVFLSQSAFGQIHVSGYAKVYDVNDHDKYLGTQYISANIDKNNPNSYVKIGKNTMKAKITRTQRDDYYKITVYEVFLENSRSYSWAVFNKYDKGYYNILIDFAETTLRYMTEKTN